MNPLSIFNLLFRRKTTGYYFLSKSLLYISIPFISSPWWIPFLKPIAERSLNIKIEDDYVFLVGIACLILGILIGLYAIFKDKQISHDREKLLALNNILNENQFITILSTFRTNAHILKTDRATLDSFFNYLNNESNKFKHPIINYRVKSLLRSSSEFDSFIFDKIFDLRGQTTLYHHFLPDKNIDLSNTVTTENEIEYDKQIDILILKIDIIINKYRAFLKSHRRLT